MLNQEVRDQALFDQIAASYALKDQVASSVTARQYRVSCAVAAVLQARPDLGVVVDIGCGIGAPARYLQGRYQKYIGVDQSAELVAAGRIFNETLPDVEYVTGNAKDSGLPDDIADVVLSIGALHHMTDLDAVLQEMTRLARPGAFLAVIEPQNGNPAVQGMRWLRTRMDGSYSEEQIVFSEQELTHLLRRNGLTAVQADFYGYTSTPFAQVILNPQSVTTPLSRLAVRVDELCANFLPGPLRPLSFDVAVTGSFPDRR